MARLKQRKAQGFLPAPPVLAAQAPRSPAVQEPEDALHAGAGERATTLRDALREGSRRNGRRAAGDERKPRPRRNSPKRLSYLYDEFSTSSLEQPFLIKEYQDAESGSPDRAL